MSEVMNHEQGWDELRNFLVDLERLNPDYPSSKLERMYALAHDTGKEHLADACALVSGIIRAYVESPQKRAGGEVLSEYYGLLEREEQRLLSMPSQSADEPDLRDALIARSEAGEMAASEMALVPRDVLPPLTRYVVLSHSQIPPLLVKAADAYRRRNALVDTVVEYGFRILWLMDAKSAEEWVLAYLHEHRGSLDPDVIRDLLRILTERDDVSLNMLDWILRWCGDFRLLENWSTVVFTGDKVLCNHAVRSWLTQNQPRNPSVAHLKLLYGRGKHDEETLLRWLETALGRLAECMLSIMRLEDRDSDLDHEQYGVALYGELRRLANVYPLVMMVGNQLLSLPDGAHRFALAVFGLAGDGLKRWETQLDTFSREVIKRMFIMDLRGGKTPVETIRRLTFGDDEAFRLSMSHLDLVSEHFDCMRQRDMVVEILVPFYASFRRAKFLALEVTRRYRKIMKLLHEDFLHEHLTEEQLKHVLADGTVCDVSAMMGEARRYLNRYRDRKASVERVLASQVDFEESTRKRRLAVIRKQLWSTEKNRP